MPASRRLRVLSLALPLAGGRSAPAAPADDAAATAGTLEGRGLRTRREIYEGAPQSTRTASMRAVRAAQALTQLMVVRTNGTCRSSTGCRTPMQRALWADLGARALEHARAAERLIPAVTGRGSADRELLHVLRVEPRDHSLDLAGRRRGTNATPSASSISTRSTTTRSARRCSRTSTCVRHGRSTTETPRSRSSSAPRCSTRLGCAISTARGVLGARRRLRARALLLRARLRCRAARIP